MNVENGRGSAIAASEMARRELAVREADAIMALSGFEKTVEMQVVDEAFVAGRVTMADKLEWVALGSLIASITSELQRVPLADDRREHLEGMLAKHRSALDNIARRFARPIVP